MTKEKAMELKRNIYYSDGVTSSRWTYIEENGYVLWHDDLIGEMKDVFEKYDIKSYIEAYAGTGKLTRILNDIGVSGKGYTLDPGDFDANGFTNKNEFTIQCLEDGILEYKDILDVPNDEFNKDMLVLCWVPYMGDSKIMSHIKSHRMPKYLLHIGEGYGGCTGGDELNEHIIDNYDVIHDFKEHVRFDHIHDNIELLKVKEQK